MTVTNTIGQQINVGDEVIYIGWQWRKYRGIFRGFSPSGFALVEVKGGETTKYQNTTTGKIFSRHNRKIWKRKPYDYYKHRATGYLIDRDDYYRLPYSERSQFTYDDGKMKSGFVEVQVPYVFAGPYGADRLFKIES